MILMGVRYDTKIDITKKIKASAKSLNDTKVNVGVLTGEHQWLAAIHEYGCTIPVTPKMRAYLHSIGVHLKKETTKIVIPERSFLRAGYDQERDSILRKADKVLPDVISGTMSEETFLDMIGTVLRDAIKEYAIDLAEPPKQDWPTRPDGFDNPLIGSSSADMVNGIEYEIER